MDDTVKKLYIDVPVKMTDLKVLFSIPALAFEGDLPAAIFHTNLIMDDIAEWGATSEVIVLFHTNAGHVALHDEAYNAERNILTGNPCRALIEGLMKRGVRVELCGVTAKFHNWGNADLIPGIKITTDAMARSIQLVRDGFVKISE